MKKLTIFLLCGFLLCIGICSAQNSNQPDNKIVIGKIDIIHSKLLNEERKIWVYVPTISEFNPKHNYPVVYLLDGDDHFRSVMAMIQELSEVQHNTTLPQMILVGIPNTDRERDLTPLHDDGNGNISAGGEVFTSFLEKELIPYIDSAYPTTQCRILIGHSLGGLFAINTLINHTQLFKSYIAIEPSMWYDKQKLLNEANKVLKEKDFTGKSLYLAIANSPAVLFKDTSTNNPYQANLKFASYIEKNIHNNLKFARNFYKDDNHTSVPFIAEYDGLRFIFSFYKFPDIDLLLDPSIKPDSLIDLNYQNISRILGYKILPPEGNLLDLGYLFLQKKLYDKSHNVFNMLIDIYPENFMSYEAMGELYKTKGDTLKAIEYYKKALSLNPQDMMARDNIEKIEDSFKDNK
jgi:uncharacterized protein